MAETDPRDLPDLRVIDTDPEGLGDLPPPSGVSDAHEGAAVPAGIEDEKGVVWEPRRETLQLLVRSRDDEGFDLVWLQQGGVETVLPYDEPLTKGRSRLLTELEASVAPPGADVEQFGTDPMQRQGEIGRTLFEALLGDPAVRQALNTSAAAAAAAGGIDAATLQLILDREAASSAQLPWELIHNGERHLLADESIRLNRHITFFGDRVSFEPVEHLRILWVSADPLHEKGSGRAQLSPTFDPVRNRIKEQLDATGRVTMDVLPHATFEQFADKVRGGGYHVVQFDGHGGFQDGKGSLSFETSERGWDNVEAERFAEVCQQGGVRLVSMIACQGSMLDDQHIFNGVATALIYARVPAVVGNQFSQWFDAAEVYNRELYASLARGESVSGAVADARSGMARETGRGIWFLPTLYLRVADGEGYLFSPEPEQHRRRREADMQRAAFRWQQFDDRQRSRHPEGPPRQNGAPVVLEEAYVDRLSEAERQAYVSYLATVPWYLYWASMSYAQQLALINYANPGVFGDIGQALWDALVDVADWVEQWLRRTFDPQPQPVPPAPDFPEPPAPPPEQPEAPPPVEERPPDGEGGGRRRGEGMPDLSGTYEYIGWWNTVLEKEAVAGRLLTIPKRLTVSHSALSITVNAVAEPTNNHFQFNGSIPDSSVEQQQQGDWEYWNIGVSITFVGDAHWDDLELIAASDQAVFRRKPVEPQGHWFSFENTSDEQFQAMTAGLREQQWGPGVVLMVPPSPRRPVVVLSSPAGFINLYYVRV